MRPMRTLALSLSLAACTAPPSDPAPGDGAPSADTADTGLAEDPWDPDASLKENCWPDLGNAAGGFPTYDDLGIVPGTLAYAAVGASGADPLGIVLGIGGLVALAVLGGTVGRRLLARTEPEDPDDQDQER